MNHKTTKTRTPLATNGIHPLIPALERRDRLTAAEKQRIETLPWRVRPYEGGRQIIAEGSRPIESCLVLEGFTARSQTLRDGQRQLTAVHVPGDFVDLHGFLIKVMDHSVVAISRCKVGFVPHESIRQITEEMPHLARLLWTSTIIDAAIQRAWITSIGRRSALMQLAHLICELFKRLQIVGLTTGNSFVFPVSQAELGDMLGLSVVHTNRTLQELRATGTVNWQKPVVTIESWEGLAEIAEFDPTYLSLHHEPR